MGQVDDESELIREHVKAGKEADQKLNAILEPAINNPDVPESQKQEARYRAAESLEEVRKNTEAYLKKGKLSDATIDYFRTSAAVLDHRRGFLLYETDRQPEAEAMLERTTQVLMDNPFQNILMLQDSFTRRGLKWSPKNVQKGLDLLQQSEELYKAWEDASPTYVPIGDPPFSSDDFDPEKPEGPSKEERGAAKTKYAQTLICLARVYGMVGDTAKAAHYCGHSLQLQLELGFGYHPEWASNCEQVADFWLEKSELAVAQHLLNCAEIMDKRSKMSEGERREREASLALSWARWYTKQLAFSVGAKRHERHYKPKFQEVPETLRYELLDPPKPDTLMWDGGFASTTDEAKEIFNVGMRKLRQGLAFYPLEDGENLVHHCNIILEISQLYRWLADFEEDRHKKCVLQKARAKRVEAVLQAVSREKNPQAYRTLQLDIGNAYREITEIKFEDARPFEKVAASAQDAIPYYQGYVETFKVNGKLPSRIDDKEAAEQFLHTVFYLARVTSRLDPPVTSGNVGCTENLRQAVVYYRYCAKFIADNGLTNEKQLAETCLEMASLIQENSEMIRVTQQRQAQLNQGA